ncbi:hypothetical protein AK88_05251, partial [Plasmodium fragile]
MDKLKNEIAKNMKGDKDEDDGIPEIMCGQVEGHNGVNFAEKQKKMCALLLRLMFYIEGLNGDGSIVHEGGGNTSMNQLEEGMKCIIGSVYIQKIMQLACWEQRIRDHALNAVDGHVNEMLTGRPSRSRQCVHWEFGNTCVGGFIPESKITQWMLHDSIVTDRVKNAAFGARCSGQDWTQRKQDMRAEAEKAHTGIHATQCAGSQGKAHFNANTGQGEHGRPPPAAAKPVAAKPASPPSSGSGTTTTSSGGSGSNGKSGAAAAGPKEGTKTAPAGECQGDRLSEWKHKPVYVVSPPNKNHLQKLHKVLDDFKTYMDEKKRHEEAYGANCYNVGWNDITTGVVHFVDQKVADVVRCRFMTLALGFANGWGTKTQDRNAGVHMNEEEENSLRCEVVNVFGHLLRHKYCPQQEKWRRGTEYAGIAFKQMKSPEQDGHGGLGGPVMEGKCTMCGYGHNKHHVDAVNLKIVEWLLQQTNILEGMEHIEGGADCNMKWKEYTVDKMKMDNPKEVDATQIPEIKKDEEKLTKEAVKTIEKVKVLVEQKIQELAAGSEEVAQPPPSAPPPVPPPPPQQSQPGQDGKQRDKGDSKSTGGAGEAGKKSKSACGVTTGSHEKEVGEGILSVSVTFDPSSDPKDCSGSNSPETPEGTSPVESQDTEKDSWSKDGAGAQSTEAPASAPSESTPTAPSRESGAKGTTGASGSPAQDGETGPSGPAGKHGEPGNSGGGSVIDGGNDEPPPLNPPKPKPPTTSPTQSGSSGSFSDADLADGVPGGAGKGGGDGTGTVSTGDFSGLDLHTPGAAGTGNPGGSHALWTPSDGLNGQPAQSGPLPGPEDKIPGETTDGSGPYPPDLTGTVLTATTPVLLFLASVIVAVLGYSLWKYFAFLGQKRRRTYRTVRDVPSPPLDDEILDHLQRGGAPPPDYGYKMIRDRQPPSTSGSARPPRVHTRTIIELHLEVLNQCEATDWENVKEDYLQIVVKQFAPEFAQDLLRDDDTNNNILGVSTSDQDPPGTHYFAFLGQKRRRTYRTVRDVPSPPLDDEILDHLQRGGAPPPDYGYKMIRDRQPPSTSGSARPPRVHTRTIIELHLEVLNQCEATDWENVKEDYLQIVVKQFAPEFAQDLLRDDDTNNNILGVSTSDQDPPGTHVSANADRPRHYRARHPTCDAPVPATHTPTCAAPELAITQTPGSGNAVTDTPTCADPTPEITQPPGSGNAVTDTPTCDHPQPVIIHPHTNAPVTDTPTDHTVTHLPTCKAVTDTPTCDHPQPEITQPPGSGDTVTDIPTCAAVTNVPTCKAVTDTPTCADPKTDITQHTVTNDTVTDTPPHAPPKPAIIHPHTNSPVTDTPTCEDPKPDITQHTLTNDTVTDTPTCDHPQPEITDIPTHDIVPDISTCADPKPEITDIPKHDTVTDRPTRDAMTHIPTCDAVTDRPTCHDPEPDIIPPADAGATVTDTPTRDALTDTATRAAPTPRIPEHVVTGATVTDTPTCDTVTDTPTCDHPQPDITQHTSTHATVTDIPTCDTVTHTTTCEDPKPEITDVPTCKALTDTPIRDTVMDIPTCKAVTDTPTCDHPQPDITQPPGSGNAVTDTHTCDDPTPDITQHTVTNDTVTDIPTCDTVTHTTTCEDPKPEITDIGTRDAVTHIPTCADPKPGITDIPTRAIVTDISKCAAPTPRIPEHVVTGATVTDTPTCETVTDTPKHDKVTDIPTCYTVTHVPTREDPKPEITDSPTCDTVTDTPT